MKKIALVITVIVLLVVMILAGGFWFLSSIAHKRTSIIQIRTEMVGTEVRKENIRILEELLVDVGSDGEKVEKVFIDAKNIVNFVEELERVAGVVGVVLDIESATFSSPQKQNLPSFRFKITGKFDDVYKYLKVLEVLPFQLAFDSFNLSKAGEGWQGQIQLTILSFINKDS